MPIQIVYANNPPDRSGIPYWCRNPSLPPAGEARKSRVLETNLQVVQHVLFDANAKAGHKHCRSYPAVFDWLRAA